MSPITIRSLADIDADIKRYTERLSIPSVLASAHWIRQTQRRIEELQDERRSLLGVAA